MAKLEEAVKAFIVERLAQFGRPQEIADAVKEQHGVVVTRQHVEEYDPEKRCTTKKWVELHKATRAAFLERKAGLAIAHRPWRLLQLEEMAREARKRRNYKLAAQLLEQAAKEEGDFYVNVRAAGTGAGDMTEDQRVERMRAQMLAMDDATTGRPLPVEPSGPSLVRTA